MGKWMTIAEKRKLIEKSEATPSMTHPELSAWAAREFRLAKAPARITVSAILKMATTIKSAAYGDGKRRKPLKVASPKLECKLGAWVSFVEKKKVNLNRNILIMKAEEIQGNVGGAALTLKLSVGWLSALMRRHGLRFRIKRGEAGSVDQAVVQDGRRKLLEVIDLYDFKDVLNMDECGLCFSRSPAGDICTYGKSGVKQDKTRITIAFCANADGSELLPPLFIGRAAHTRCFGKKSAEDLGYSYMNNKKAWMTTTLFQRWLRELDAKMPAEDRNVLLLLDNASSHTSGDLQLTNVTIKILPPNTTPCLQPMDAGVIASFKSRYRSRQIAQAIARVENSEDVEGAKAYKIDQLTTMNWSQEIWSATNSATLRHCWQHTGLILPLRDGEFDIECDDKDGSVSDLALRVDHWSVQ